MAVTDAPKLNKDGSPRKAPTKGKVESQIVEVTELPKFAGKERTRTSDIDVTLAGLAKSLSPGKTVSIRQYSKKESANGTMYNLRSRYNGSEKNPSEHVLRGLFEFNIGPIDVNGEEYTGLYVTRTNGKVAKS